MPAERASIVPEKVTTFVVVQMREITDDERLGGGPGLTRVTERVS
jgi:hypothetical protein